jgi:hypothetical protein
MMSFVEAGKAFVAVLIGYAVAISIGTGTLLLLSALRSSHACLEGLLRIAIPIALISSLFFIPCAMVVWALYISFYDNISARLEAWCLFGLFLFNLIVFLTFLSLGWIGMGKSSALGFDSWVSIVAGSAAFFATFVLLKYVKLT